MKKKNVNVTIGKRIFKNGNTRTYLEFSNGKRVVLQEEEARALNYKLNFHLQNGHTKINI